MNILVTGAKGQLGTEIKKQASLYKKWHFIFCDSSDLEITDIAAIDTLVKQKGINAIVNCAAYTAVDLAQTNEKQAYAVNATGAENLAKLASQFQLKFIHISTDFVFDGTSSTPYTETDTPNPLSVYGKTKLAGEQAVLSLCPEAIILRTSWLYSAYGRNFVKTVQSLARERDSLNMVSDQIGTPTWANDLASAVLIILAKLGLGNKCKGIYHYANEGKVSWYNFAVEIIEQSALQCEVHPIKTEAYPTAAVRPAFSVLDTTKIKRDFGVQIPFWKRSLERCLTQITN